MAWRLITEDGVSAAGGLAVDETLARRVGTGDAPATLRLYTYRPHCALVGRFQDARHEVLLAACEREGVAVNRRPTGGGAILMGPDQLGVALALPQGDGGPSNVRERMRVFSEGVRRGLARLGVTAEFRGKNDLVVNGRKIAGLGVHRNEAGGLLFHASVLVDLDVALMARVLRTPFEKVTRRELAIVAGRTATVRRLAGDHVTTAGVRALVAGGFSEAFDVGLEPGELEPSERAAAQALERERYGTAQWVFQETQVPDTSGLATLATSAGLIEVRLALAGRTIKSALVRGDFIEDEGAIADLEGRLRWHPADEESIAATVGAWSRQRTQVTLDSDAVTRAIVAAALGEPSEPPRPYGCFVTPGSTSEAARRAELTAMRIRRANFPDRIRFHAPGLKRYATSEYETQDAAEFVSISVTGTACALSCEHCKVQVLRGMDDLTRFEGSLFELCARLHERGARGVLISGGSDARGRVPLLEHVPDLVRVRRELDMLIRVHPGLPDEETCAGLAEVGIDGAMVDIIGHADTIRDVYHMDASVEEYDAVLERLERLRVPTVPHIILGLHFGRMLGEERALAIVARHSPRLLVLVVLMPLNGTPMGGVQPPSLEEIGAFFESARSALPATPVMLGCARPIGDMKADIDRLAVDCGLNGIAYPADGIVAHARSRGLEPTFVNACCGVSW